MRIVHINADPVDAAGGAAVAMRTMVESQRRAGHEVIVLSRADMTGAYRALHFAARVLMKLAFGHCYSGGLLPSGLGRRADGLKPDVVYLHRLQNGTLGMREILRIQAPKKWYFHDMWPLNGVCPYWKEELFALPMPRRMRELDRRSRALKREIGRRAKDLEIVVASEWMRGGGCEIRGVCQHSGAAGTVGDQSDFQAGEGIAFVGNRPVETPVCRLLTRG